MQKFLKEIYTGDKNQAVKDVLDTYKDNGYVWINFFYFAYIKAQKLYLTKSTSQKNSKLQKRLRKKFWDFSTKKLYIEEFPYKKKYLPGPLADCSYQDYHNAILAGDFLFCDGIALQVAYFLLKLFKKIPDRDHQKFWLQNLNGTDFLPYFFDELTTKYGNHKLNVILYGSYPDYVKRTKEYFIRKGINVVYIQNGYSELNWNKVEEGIGAYKDKINVLLVARSHPDLPIQELWVQQNLREIKKYNLITFTVGWLFDHLIGVQSRWPKFIRVIKLEWLWRLITSPKRNYRKVLNILSGFSYIFWYLLLKKR